MKRKTNIFIILTLGVMFLTSCEVEVPEPEILDTKQVFTFEVRASDWIENIDEYELNRYYSCNFKLRNLNPGISLDHCAVMGYASFGDYDQPLPLIRHFENLSGEMWTRTVDYEVSLYDVTFYVTNSDFIKEQPETMYFRVVFMW